MSAKDTRWIQRFSNYKQALSKLTEVVESKQLNELSELEREGLIQRFEYTFELSWNVMKDYFVYQGKNEINGPRDAIREAFQNGIIANGDLWMKMIISRNKTSHTYNSQTAEDISEEIYAIYFQLFVDFKGKMTNFQSEQTSMFP